MQSGGVSDARNNINSIYLQNQFARGEAAGKVGKDMNAENSESASTAASGDRIILYQESHSSTKYQKRIRSAANPQVLLVSC